MLLPTEGPLLLLIETATMVCLGAILICPPLLMQAPQPSPAHSGHCHALLPAVEWVSHSLGPLHIFLKWRCLPDMPTQP